MDEDKNQNQNKKINFIQRKKFGWFSSLRCKKDLQTRAITSDSVDSAEVAAAAIVVDEKQTKDENFKENIRNKNLFQRIKFKMDFKFKQNYVKTNQNEIVHSSPSYNRITNTYNNAYIYTQMAKKWLEQDSGPNLIMFKASMEMINYVWYWGHVSRTDAQKQLTDKPNGSFLVRDSESGGSQFTLSFRICNCTFHYRLQYLDNYWHFYELKYKSIVEMIEDIQQKSSDSKFLCFVKTNIMSPPIPVFLRYPISRYIEMTSLQELCKRALLQYLPESNRNELIEQLPIPVKLQEYLLEKSEIIF